MSHFEDLSSEILMSIFEYMDVEDVWTIFFNMNTRFNSLVFDSHLRLTADISKVDQNKFDQFFLSLLRTNFNNIFTLILSNNYYRYPQIRMFLSHTNFSYFQSLYSLTLIDINHDELMEITEQIKQLNHLNHLHIHTHEIFYDKQLANVSLAVLNQPNIRVLGMRFHEKIQWSYFDIIPDNKIEVLSLNYINIDRLFDLLSHCPQLRSLCMTLDSRPMTSLDGLSVSFPCITHLRFYFRPFDLPVLERLLASLPSVKRFSIDTIVYKMDHIRAPTWTLLFQERLPNLERIRLVLRGFNLFKMRNQFEGTEENLIDGYRYDRYWLDRTMKNEFICRTDDSATVLLIR